MISASQIRGARAMLEWTQQDLAENSGLSLPTIQRIEANGTEQSSVATVTAIKTALEKAGIVFISKNGGGPGVRLKK